MPETHTDVSVGGYRDLGAAASEFDALALAVADETVTFEAAILMTRRGGAVGILVGLPPCTGDIIAVIDHSDPLAVERLVPNALAGRSCA